MRWPSVSIIIPSYNQGKYIERTLLSTLKQEYAGPVQVIVSDGGSTDETRDILRQYPEVTWWSEPDKGYVDAVNKGFAKATGDVYAIQSSDDFYLKDAFQVSVGALLEQKELSIVSGTDIKMREDGSLDSFSTLSSEPMSLLSLLKEDHIPQHCAFFRREVLHKIGPLRPEVDRCADTDLWYRALHFFQGRYIPHHTAVYQLHMDQRTQSQAEAWVEAFGRMVESCEQDEQYARCFQLSETDKEEVRLKTQMVFYGRAGGSEGHQKARAAASEILSGKTKYSQKLVAYAGRTYRAGMSAPDKFLSSVKHGSLLRDMQEKWSRKADTNTPQTPVDLDWWRH